MSSLNFPDVNVWIALLWERHVHADKAMAWFMAHGDERFFFCRFTQITVLRLLTTEKLMGPDVRSMAGAWELWDTIWADERVSFLPEPAGLEAEFRAHSRLATRSPKVWADAYLLAFAALTGVKLVTFDRALASKAEDVLTL